MNDSSKILVVDDVEHNRDLLARRLSRKGYAVSLAAGGREALERIGAEAFDCVLLDVMMPEIDGLQVLDGIREQFASDERPVIMVTAKQDSADVVTCLKQGANDFVSKPIDFAVLFARLEAQVTRKQAVEQLVQLNQTLDSRVKERTRQLQRSSSALIESESRYRDLYDETPVMMFTVDRNAQILSMNAYGTSVLGYGSDEELGGRPLTLLFPSELHAEILNYFDHWIDQPGQLHSCEIEMKIKDGERIWTRMVVRTVGAPDGQTRLLTVVEDITKAHNLHQELEYRASYDPLTGLLNRAELVRRLDQVCQRAREGGDPAVICYLDLDHFKVINDTCGHSAGDELLRRVCAELSSNLNPQDSLARMGADEFALLMPSTALEEAEQRAEEIIKAVDAFRFLWRDERHGVGISIGIAPVEPQRGGANELLSKADATCNAAKQQGRGRYLVHQDGDMAIREHLQQMEWVNRVQTALDDDRFVLFAQPIRPALEDREPGHLGYEVLVRMLNGGEHPVPPGAFLPAAERYGLSAALDRWVVDRTLRLLEESPAHLAELSHCGINLSGPSVNNAKFLDYLEGRLRDTSVPADKLCFEITETAAIGNLREARYFVERLKSFGCKFALDDFGSGLSSFGYLKTLPVDFLKIDGQFVKDMLGDLTDRAMVKAINEVAGVMKMATIAEFVENDDLRELLATMGVDLVQGYGVGKPAPFTDLLEPGRAAAA